LISVEEALLFEEEGRLYYIANTTLDAKKSLETAIDDKLDIICLRVSNIEFYKKKCRLILFSKLTNFAKASLVA
jgi:hypothetical protein